MTLDVYCTFASRTEAEQVCAGVTMKDGDTFVRLFDGVPDIATQTDGWTMYGLDRNGPEYGVRIIDTPGVRATLKTAAITGISLTNPITVTAPGHTFLNGENVQIEQVIGGDSYEYQRWTGQLDGNGDPIMETRTRPSRSLNGGWTITGVVAGVSFQLQGLDGTAQDAEGNNLIAGYVSGGLAMVDLGWAVEPTYVPGFHANVRFYKPEKVATWDGEAWALDPAVIPPQYVVTLATPQHTLA